MAKKERPGGLLAIAVIALVLGGLGGCMGLWGVVGNAFQETMSDKQMELIEESGGSQRQAEMQRQMQERLLEVTRKWRPAVIGHQALNAIVSIFLLAAGIMLLRWNPKGLQIFFAAAIGNLVVDLGGGILQMFMQMETNEVMQQMMRDITTSDPNAPAGMGRMMDGIMQASAGVGVCFAVGWGLLKIGYYVAGLLYLRKDHVQRLFSDEPPSGGGYGPPPGPQQAGPPPQGPPPAA